VSAPGLLRPRVLVADAEEGRRRDLRAALGGDFAVAEASGADEAVAWLQGQEPGLTLLDHGLPGAAGAELVARLKELYPHELVLILAPEPSLGLTRAAMRAGAYDCLDRGALVPEQLRAVCESAAARLEEAGRQRRAVEEQARGAVRRHEREAAGRLSTADSLAAWKAIEVTERRRWVEAYLRAVAAPEGSPERDRALGEVSEPVSRCERPGVLLAALHAHAVASPRPSSSDESVDRSREALVRLLGLVADALALRTRAREGGRAVPAAASAPAAAPGAAPASPADARRASDGLAWHRWRLGAGQEEWTLALDGRLVARVATGPSGCRGWVRTSVDADRLEAVVLPPVPDALREIERRLGLPFVLDVRTAIAP
jgi:DNA-binding NarL/FixJ family response regulator